MLCARPTDAAAEVTAMDRHICRLHEILGRPPQAKVHWVRGRLMGLGAVYVQGMALGSARPEGEDSGGRLTYIDRHEVAHFVIQHLCGPDSGPPFVLIEGWAECQSDDEPGRIATRAWRQRCEGPVPTVRELTGKEWYHLDYGLVYTLGGALVEYLLHEYGGEKFFELYSNCRADTFAQDCRRFWRWTLDELDRDYWRYVDEQAGAERQLRNLQLDDHVDRQAWDSLLTQYSRALETLALPLPPIRLVWEHSVYGRAGENPARTLAQCRQEFVYDGSQRMVISEWHERTQALVATPRLSFELLRDKDNPRWKAVRPASRGAAVLDYYHGIGPSVERAANHSHALPVRWVHGWLSPYSSDRSPTVTGLERLERDGKKLVRIQFRRTVRPERELVTEHGMFEVMPDEHWALHSYQLIRETGDKFASSSRVQCNLHRCSYTVRYS